MLTVMHFLTIARDHGLPVPQLYRRPLHGAHPNTATVHYWDCETESDLEPLSYEDFGGTNFPISDCPACYHASRQDKDGAPLIRVVAALPNVVTAGQIQLRLEAKFQDLYAAEAENWQSWTRLLDDYILLRHRHLTTAAGHRSRAADEAALIDAHPLSDFMYELFEDLSRQAVRLAASNPITAHLRQRFDYPSEPLIRAVWTSVTGIASDLNVSSSEDAALIAERDTLHTGRRGWRIITWDAALEEFELDTRSTAPAGDYTELELIHALEVYAQNPSDSDFADILAAVRVATAA